MEKGIYAMLHTKFQASEPSGSEEKDVLKNIFLCISMLETQDPLVQSHYAMLHTKFQVSKLNGSKEMF